MQKQEKNAQQNAGTMSRVRESVGRMANGVSTEEIHAMMGRIFTDPVAHDAAAELCERLC